MKRLGTVLLAGVVILAIAAPAGVAGPDCDKHPDHPKCDTSTTTTIPGPGHPDGLTCQEAADADQVFTGTDGFAITLDPGNGGCVDWTTTSEEEWTISVDPGDAGSVYFNIRDSHPGDFCWIGDLGRKELRNGQTTLFATHANGPLADGGPLPIAVVDACGPEYTDDADSLVFTVIPGGKPSTVTVTVTPTS